MRRSARLLGYLRPYRVAFAGGVLAALLASALDGFTFALLIPLLRVMFGEGAALAPSPTWVERVTGWVAGGWLGGDPATALRNIVLLILLAIAAKNVATAAAAHLAARVHEGVLRDLRTALFGHFQRLSLRFHGRDAAGHHVSRMFADVDQAGIFFEQVLQTLIRQGLVVAVYVAMLFTLSWRLTMVTLVCAPLIALALVPLLRRARMLFTRAAELRGELTARFSETLRGAREVKTFVAEAHERERFGAALERYRGSVVGARTVAGLSSPVSETLAAGVFVTLLTVGTWTLGSDGMRPEILVTYLAVALRVLSPLKHIAHFPSVVIQAGAGADRVFAVLDRPPDDVDAGDEIPFPGFADAIEFRDVWFGYEDGHAVLRGASLTVRRGEVAAIVGPSGVGKSTLVDLLPRLIDPQRGAVLLDGVPTTAFTRASLRRAVAVVGQETIVFNDTVWANIAYGDVVDRDAIVAAATAANAHEFISRLPQGYDTRLGERGTRLSGGERQRIAVARALLRDPPLLVLDEATSALDGASERAVQDAIARLMEHRTVFIVAHRLSSVVHADVIAVLDEGRIVERGRHAELLAAGGRYRDLHDVEASRVG